MRWLTARLKNYAQNVRNVFTELRNEIKNTAYICAATSERLQAHHSFSKVNKFAEAFHYSLTDSHVEKVQFSGKSEPFKSEFPFYAKSWSQPAYVADIEARCFTIAHLPRSRPRSGCRKPQVTKPG